MIFVVNSENLAPFDADLLEMHRQRKFVFVDGAGWNVPVVAGLEIDQYDCATTTYLLVKAAPDGELLGSARLLPTAGPHLMTDLVPDSLQIAYPQGPAIWEVSRFCPSPRLCRRARIRVVWEVICGVIETALLFGAHEVVFATNSALLPLVLNSGWGAKCLGSVRRDSEDQITVVAASITPDDLRRVRQRHGVAVPVTRFHAEPAVCREGRCNNDQPFSDSHLHAIETDDARRWMGRPIRDRFALQGSSHE